MAKVHDVLRLRLRRWTATKATRIRQIVMPTRFLPTRSATTLSEPSQTLSFFCDGDENVDTNISLEKPLITLPIWETINSLIERYFASVYPVKFPLISASLISNSKTAIQYLSLGPIQRRVQGIPP